MKKLMTMLSAAALAFGLRAADTGTSFEGMDAGPLDTASKIGELTPQEDGQSYWSATNENCAATVVEGQSIARSLETKYPSQYIDASQKKYLDVKTTFGNPLERKAKADGTGVALAENSFYIDTLVKFTIFDSEPEFSKYEGAKLMAWLQEDLDANDEPTGVTNFCIRAGYANKQTRTYVMDTIFEPTAWHRLTVKAIPTIYKDDDVPGFVVFVDGEAMGAVSEGNKDHGIDNSKVDARYLDFLDQGRLFLSMDQGSSGQAISAVAFDGQGCVDDLVFTGTQPFDAAADSAEEYVTLTWDVSGVSGLSYTVAGGEKVTPDVSKGLALIRYKAGMTIAISDVTYAEGYMASAFEATWTPTAANESMKISSSKAAAKFGDTSYATMAEALEVAMAATVSGTLKLFADYAPTVSETEFINAACVITLDLAGKTFKGSIGAYDGGSLIIIDSVGGGIVDGFVGADGGTLEIRGGKYKVKEPDAGYFASLSTYATAGKIFELDAAGEYYVLEDPKVAQIGDDKYVSLAAAIAAAYNGDTITMIANTTFDEPLAIAKELTLDLADAEVKWTGDMGTYPIVISNGVLTIQATTTNEDVAATGAIVKESASATLIRVGVKGAGTDPEADGWVAGTAGTLVINGGTFKAAASNVIKVEKGSLTLNGGYVENTAAESLNYRGIRAAKEDGVLANEVTITVNGGTIVAADPLNQQTEGHGTITIPAGSTAKFSKDVSTFCEEGYETVLKDGFYVVQKKGSEPEVKPVTPGAETEYDSEEAAQKAADAINANPSAYIKAPATVEEAYAAEYYKAFVATAKGATVVVDLRPEAVTQIQASVDTEIKKIDVAAVAAADGVSKQKIATVPGLYYSVIAGDSLTGMAVKWCELATGIEKEISLPKGEGATSGFYKIQATVQEVPVVE